MSVAHTPTPWRVEEGTDLIWGACDLDDQSTYGMGYSIVQGKSGSWGQRRPDMDEREANAAFIVKACNAHDDLVKALEEARKQLVKLRDAVEASGTMNNREKYLDLGIAVNAAINRAHHALAKGAA